MKERVQSIQSSALTAQKEASAHANGFAPGRRGGACSMIAIIDQRKCPAQKTLCQPMQVCPKQAIFFQEDPALPLGGRMHVDRERCDGCGLCVEVCCGNAIEIK